MKSLIDLLTPGVDKQLAIKIVEHYEQMKRNYLLERHGPSEIDGGQFVEAISRVIELAAFRTYTPIGTTIDIDKLFRRIEPLKGKIDESLRIDIPRTLRSIYDVRNRRGSAHLSLLNPNLMDSTYVISTCDWVMAEMVRIYSSLTPDEAQIVIDKIIERKIPLVEEFENDLVVLDNTIRVQEQIIILLYRMDGDYIDVKAIKRWIPGSELTEVQNVMNELENLRFAYQRNGYRITRKGIQLVEGPKPIDIDLEVKEISKFIEQKNATRNDDMVLLMGYWLQRKKGMLTFTVDDVTTLYKQLSVKLPKNPSQYFSRNSGKGFFDRISPGVYAITDEGVEHAYRGFG